MDWEQNHEDILSESKFIQIHNKNEEERERGNFITVQACKVYILHKKCTGTK